MNVKITRLKIVFYPCIEFVDLKLSCSAFYHASRRPLKVIPINTLNKVFFFHNILTHHRLDVCALFLVFVYPLQPKRVSPLDPNKTADRNFAILEAPL